MAESVKRLSARNCEHGKPVNIVHEELLLVAEVEIHL
jgi:hypothetical protein